MESYESDRLKMEKITSKPSYKFYFAIALVLFLGTAPLFIGGNVAPLWVSCVMWGIGFALLFANKTTIYSEEAITTKFIAGRRPIILKKEDIDTITEKIEGEVTAQRVGLMKKDKAIHIIGKDPKRVAYVNERYDSQYQQIRNLLKKHYKECWDRGAGEVM
jgi:hypothetical protein